jgi:hypothetical protein
MKKHNRATPLPSIDEIVQKRIKAGIAGLSELELYLDNDLDDSEFSDEEKRALLAELKKPKPKSKARTHWLTPKVYKGKSMCELGTCDCDPK